MRLITSARDGFVRLPLSRRVLVATLLVVGTLVAGSATGTVAPPAANDPVAAAEGTGASPSGRSEPVAGSEVDPPSVPSPSDRDDVGPSAPSPAPTVASPAPVAPAQAAWTVTNIVDGDTLDVRSSTGTVERVRLVGIDTPERGECGFEAAAAALSSLVLDRPVGLVAGARDDRDRYDRLLRYVDADGTDAGLTLIEQGLAVARYDSRDGYGAHALEGTYVAADEATSDVTCPAASAPPPSPAPQPAAAPASGNPWGSASCHPAYDPCVPPPSETGDLNCPDIRRHHPGGVSVDHAHGDPHGLDGDRDGHGCD